MDLVLHNSATFTYSFAAFFLSRKMTCLYKNSAELTEADVRFKWEFHPQRIM